MRVEAQTAPGIFSDRAARLAGLLYLGTIVGGVFAEVVARGSLIVGADAGATATAILANEALFRAGLVGDVVMLACYVGVTTLLYGMFRPVHQRVSQMAAAFSLTGIAVLASATLLLLAPLRLLAASTYLAAIGLDQREAAALLALKIHGDGYDVSLIFFGIYCLMLGWLIWRSGSLPRIIGALMGVAGACYLMNSVAGLAAPGFARILSPYVMLPTLIGEGALAIWLIVFGAGHRSRRSVLPH